MKYEITYAMYTDIGNREVNEDSISVFNNGDNRGFVLCDGLGGMGMGNIASDIVTKVFKDVFSKNENIKEYLDNAFNAAQQILLEEQKRYNAEAKMKTTAVAVVFDNKKAYIGHIGDSRLYAFNNNGILFRTLDHSISQMLALTGEIKESEIRTHKNRSVILRTMGVKWDEPMYELRKPVPLKKCDAFLLCSDGLWENVEEAEMCELLAKADSPDTWLKDMAVLAKKKAKDKDMDNNSAIAIWVK